VHSCTAKGEKVFDGRRRDDVDVLAAYKSRQRKRRRHEDMLNRIAGALL
jgi:hypothetical protein